jgi:hypothetical protein
MPYTHFQYIAYQIPTVATTNDRLHVIYGLPSTPVQNPPILDGPTANLNADARNRVERLIGAMRLAEARIQQLGDNNHTLKIFLAPEFYLRPDVRLVSYSSVEYRAIKEVLRATIRRDVRFEHWLVVPGTIMWTSLASTDKRPNLRRQNVYFNSAIYVYPGEPSHVIEKAKASPIDGIPTTHHGGPVVDPHAASTDEAFGLKYRSDAKRRKHLFTIGGVRFGLDICLEHGFRPDPLLDIRITKNAVIRNQPIGVQIHLLTAGGMTIMPESVAASQRGYILRNDGFNTRADLLATNCQRILRYILSGRNTSVYDPSGRAELSPDVPRAATINIGADHDLYLPPPANADRYWGAHPQQINIYPRLDIPAAQRVHPLDN